MSSSLLCVFIGPLVRAAFVAFIFSLVFSNPYYKSKNTVDTCWLGCENFVNITYIYLKQRFIH